jgi:p-aminobenzoyl-glutamate transporter AbgT
VITASLALAAGRIALAIVLDTVALVVWNVGTRPPVQLFADIRAAFGNRSSLVRGSTRFALGAVALLAAVTVSAPVAARRIDFSIVECWALVVALVVEQIVGPDLRAQRRRRRPNLSGVRSGHQAERKGFDEAES